MVALSQSQRNHDRCGYSGHNFYVHKLMYETMDNVTFGRFILSMIKLNHFCHGAHVITGQLQVVVVSMHTAHLNVFKQDQEF